MSLRSPVILESAEFRLTIVSCGDRLAHTLGLKQQDHVVPLLASLEGTPDDDWPPSPPLTTVELPASCGATQAMLLGMAGRSHWSASIAIQEAKGRVEFELACRINEPAAWLGSTYRTMVAAVADSDGAKLQVGSQCVRVTATGARLQITPAGLKIAVALPDGPFPHTVRWNYFLHRTA